MPSILSLFPELFTYQQVAPFILRLVLAMIFIGNGYSKIFKTFTQTSGFFASIGFKPGKFWAGVVGSVELASGVMFLTGFLTQLAAILVAIIIIVAIVRVKIKQGFLGGYDFDLLVLACALSLLLLGPGIFSIDLPL